ncbi:methyltransferase domain-containing protein [Streptomyces sp. NPDC020681]|uniref:methyltransferase domain-containing protein n=1 Tax=Streptomyces sp. NPDC020681 TaxID=3365083 RepID=UPI0037877F5A
MTWPNMGATSALRQTLAAEIDTGQSSKWLSAFGEVPRHHFTPTFFRQDARGDWNEVTWGDPGYLETVYSNTALTTQLDEHGIPTSSSSEPALMLAMLDALDVESGDTVFELGTGTGYNAALLAYRLGPENVTTMDVDPELVTRASDRLSTHGQKPLVIAGDGALGYSARAPYSRIIATAALRCIPPALLNQASVGAVIVAPIGFGVARVTVTAPGHATGRFLPTPAHFMPRRTPGTAPDFAALTNQPATHNVLRVPDALDRLKFPMSLALPGYNSCSWRDEGGNLSGIGLWTDDGSIALADAAGRVRQTGPRRLWDAITELAEIFPHGAPARDDFGLTIAPAHQSVWYREQGGPCWTLATT